MHCRLDWKTASSGFASWLTRRSASRLTHRTITTLHQRLLRPTCLNLCHLRRPKPNRLPPPPSSSSFSLETNSRNPHIVHHLPERVFRPDISCSRDHTSISSPPLHPASVYQSTCQAARENHLGVRALEAKPAPRVTKSNRAIPLVPVCR